MPRGSSPRLDMHSPYASIRPYSCPMSLGRLDNTRVVCDSCQLRCDTRLVTDVELQQHGGEGLDGRRVRQLTRVEGSATGNPRDDLADRQYRRGVVATDQHIGIDRLVECPSSVAGRWWKRGRPHDSVARRPAHGPPHSPRGGTSGWNSLFTRTSAFGHRDDDLVGEGVFVLLGGARRRIPWSRDDDQFASAAAALSPCASRPARSGQGLTSSSTASIARYLDREPITTS